MNKNTFHNAIRILMNIDLHELVDAGIIVEGQETGTCWTRFNNDPLIFIAKLTDEKYDALWQLIEARQPERYREQS